MAWHRDAQRSRQPPRTDAPGGRGHRAARRTGTASSSVTNLGCGEDWWTPDLPGYVGLDVAPEAVEVASRNHPDRRYIVWDGHAHVGGDLILCRDVVQHLSMADGLGLVRTIQQAHSGYLLASTYIDGDNIDIETGDAYRPNLEAEPFNLPPALLLIHDGYEYHDGDRLRDPGKMLGLWRL